MFLFNRSVVQNQSVKNLHFTDYFLVGTRLPGFSTQYVYYIDGQILLPTFPTMQRDVNSLALYSSAVDSLYKHVHISVCFFFFFVNI